MNAPARLGFRSSLAGVAPSETSPEEFDALRARAWTERGFVLVQVDEVPDEWLRQGLINWATLRYGRRMRK